MHLFTTNTATVYAKLGYMIVSGLPFLLGKLRAWVEIIDSCSDTVPILMTWLEPVLTGGQGAPA